MASNDPLVFIDASFLLDVILPNRRRYELAKKFLAKEPSLAISSLSVHLAVHFGKKYSLSPSDVRNTLAELKILPIDATTVNWAFEHMIGGDYEDALQVACAVLGECQEFVTFDRSLAKNYSRFIKVVVPR